MMGSTVLVLGKTLGLHKLMPINDKSKGRKKIKVFQYDFVEKRIFQTELVLFSETAVLVHRSVYTRNGLTFV